MQWDGSELPVYGCITGVEVGDRIDIVPGFILRPAFVDTFGITMMAFGAPASPNEPHPTPWAAVQGGHLFEARAELALTSTGACGNMSPWSVCWLATAVLRLRAPTPMRLAVIANMPFAKMRLRWKEVQAVAFETAPYHLGDFSQNRTNASSDHVSWLRQMLPTAVCLYRDDRFVRAFSLYDQAQWAPTPAMASVLIWTAIEVLFDLGGVREKTKAISNALSNYIGIDRPDRDRTYQVVQDQYQKRGKEVHTGRDVSIDDTIQGFRLARVAFQRVLIDGRLP